MEVGWRAPGTGLKYSNDLWEAGGGEGCDWEEIPEKIILQNVLRLYSHNCSQIPTPDHCSLNCPGHSNQTTQAPP